MVPTGTTLTDPCYFGKRALVSVAQILPLAIGQRSRAVPTSCTTHVTAPAHTDPPCRSKTIGESVSADLRRSEETGESVRGWVDIVRK